ncbi:MAG: HAD hydrolase family protein [Solirubrobacterales bacterium]|nr:HAD hydrolase family protein [Solirubrobacterales bacterium]
MTARPGFLCAACGPVPTPRLVVVDLDGTALDEADRLHPADRAALRRAAASCTVAVATARPAPDAARWADEIGADTCIALGGAVTVSAGLVGTATPVPPDALDHLRGLAVSHRADLHLHTLTAWHPSADTPTARAYGRRHGLTPIPGPPRDLVLMAELVAPPGGLARFVPTGPLAGPDTVATRSDDAQGDYLVVTAGGADKRAALARVLSVRGLDWADVLAFGDGALDAPVLAAARTGVTFGHAHPLARESATHTLTTGPGAGSIAAALAALVDRTPGRHPLLTCLHRKDAA